MNFTQEKRTIIDPKGREHTVVITHINGKKLISNQDILKTKLFGLGSTKLKLLRDRGEIIAYNGNGTPRVGNSKPWYDLAELEEAQLSAADAEPVAPTKPNRRTQYKGLTFIPKKPA